MQIAGQAVTLVALPLLFQQAQQAGKAPSPEVNQELLDLVKIYNRVPASDEAATLAAIGREYAAYWSAAGQQWEAKP